MEEQVFVHIKEYFEALWREREKNISLQFLSNNERLNATAIVIEHRLEVLNHAHEQSVRDRSDFLLDGEFKTFKKDLNSWQGVVDNSITTLNTRYDSRITAATWISFVALIVSLASTVYMVTKF